VLPVDLRRSPSLAQAVFERPQLIDQLLHPGFIGDSGSGVVHEWYLPLGSDLGASGGGFVRHVKCENEPNYLPCFQQNRSSTTRIKPIRARHRQVLSKTKGPQAVRRRCGPSALKIAWDFQESRVLGRK
jgi:hypothetical protein